MTEQFIIGFQWSPTNNKYIGEYSFPNNKDKEEVHLPPYTTLERPPVAPAGSAAYRKGENWVIEADPSQVKTKPPINDYLMLMPDFIEYLKNEGLWTAEDDAKLQSAIEENEKKQAEFEAMLAAQNQAKEGGAA